MLEHLRTEAAVYATITAAAETMSQLKGWQ